jgi:alkanesulfonate monooxygenase SsuD/methylene tetrahydromethanopterin reductase-like flavin-dependent oxidoreductase (luciferase family)
VRIDRMVETVAVLRACFDGGLVDVVGDHVHAVGFEGVPRPPSGQPPLMIGGGSRRVLGIAGAEADIVSLNFDNSSGKIGPAGVGSSTAEQTKRKIEWIRDGAGDRFDDVEIEIAGYFTVVTDDRSGTIAQMAPMLGLEPDALERHPHALIGSIDAICEQLEQRREEFGISYVTVGSAVVPAFAPVVERLAGT